MKQRYLEVDLQERAQHQIIARPAQVYGIGDEIDYSGLSESDLIVGMKVMLLSLDGTTQFTPTILSISDDGYEGSLPHESDDLRINFIGKYVQAVLSIPS